MFNNKVKNFILFLIVFILSALTLSAETERDLLIHEFLNAENLFLEGKYLASQKKLKNILKIDPGYPKAQELLSKAKKQYGLTSSAISNAIDDYQNGSLQEALDKLGQAYYLDPNNYELRTLQLKILTELGMQYSFVGKHVKALSYLKMAQELMPNDDTINELIRMNSLMNQENSQGISKISASENNDMVEAFQKYQANQELWLKTYRNDDEKFGLLQQSSHKQKEKLLKLIEAKDSNSLFHYIHKIIPLATLLTIMFVIFYNLKSIAKKKSTDIDQDMEYKKKIKKLDIIEKEMGGTNLHENQIGLNMLEEFINDTDYRIRLRVIKVLHEIDPATAIDLLKGVLDRPESHYKRGGYEVLKSLRSPESLQLLYKLLESELEADRDESARILYEISEDAAVTNSLRADIIKNLKNFASQEDWIVS